MSWSRATCERLINLTKQLYSDENLQNKAYKDGFIEGLFAKPWHMWNRYDVKNNLSSDVLDNIWGTADAGYYDLVCDILPAVYQSSNAGVLNYIRDVSAGLGRPLPANFAKYEAMIRGGSAPAITVSDAGSSDNQPTHLASADNEFVGHGIPARFNPKYDTISFTKAA